MTRELLATGRFDGKLARALLQCDAWLEAIESDLVVQIAGSSEIGSSDQASLHARRELAHPGESAQDRDECGPLLELSGELDEQTIQLFEIAQKRYQAERKERAS